MRTLLTPETTKRFTDAGYWGTDTIYALLDGAARANPDKTAVIDRDVRLTFAEVKRRVDRLAAALYGLGIRPGDVVAVQLPNWKELIECYFAIARLGAVIMPVHLPFRKHELDFMLRFTGAKLVVVPDVFGGFDFRVMVDEVRRGNPALSELAAVVVGDPAEDMRSWEELMTTPHERRHGTAVDGITVNANDVFGLMFSSGTTATPKGVMHSHNTLMFDARTAAELFGVRSDDIVLILSPLTHGVGFTMALFCAFAQGATVVCVDKFSGAEVLRLLEEERVTYAAAVPTMLIDILAAYDEHPRDVSTLRTIPTAGAPIPTETVRMVKAKLGARVTAAYGMTEDMVLTTTRLDDPPDVLAETVGRPLPGCAVRVVDGDLNDVAPGEIGELLHYGPNLCLGYYDNPEQNRETFLADGYCRSGDLGVLREDGNAVIVGRLKDMYIRGGKNVYPAEVEEVLYQHPRVEKVAIVGVPHDRLGEIGCAFVSTTDGEALTVDEVTTFLEERGVAKFMWPERVETISSFPMTPTGKILKRELREMANVEPVG